MNEVSRRIRAVRRTLRVRERTHLVDAVTYCCPQCGMRQRVSLARGVASPDRVAPEVYGLVPAPKSIPCRHCDEQMRFVSGSLEQRAEGLSVRQPYLRVPSRRAAAKMAESGVLEAQLVRPEDR